jgi:hypothetical protein
MKEIKLGGCGGNYVTFVDDEDVESALTRPTQRIEK